MVQRFFTVCLHGPNVIRQSWGRRNVATGPHPYRLRDAPYPPTGGFLVYASNGLPVKELYQWPEGTGVQVRMRHCSLKLCGEVESALNIGIRPANPSFAAYPQPSCPKAKIEKET